VARDDLVLQEIFPVSDQVKTLEESQEQRSSSGLRIFGFGELSALFIEVIVDSALAERFIEAVVVGE